MKEKSRQDVVINIQFNNIDELRSSIDNKFHYFYKIVNNINGNFYYGIHSTYNILDDYSGSGIILRQVYKKYGKCNCTKYIEKIFDDRKSLLDYEKYVVNEKLIQNNKCYNLITGGIGSFLDNKNKSNNYYDFNKNKIHINDGVKNKLISPSELDAYLKNGWRKGESYSSTKGRIVVNNGSIDRFIYEHELEDYLTSGWRKGGVSRNKNQTSFANGTIWINNGINQIRINSKLLQSYEEYGWRKGTVQNTTKNYIRITNGSQVKNINPNNTNELEYYLSNGWRKGSCNKTTNGKFWINNGKETILIDSNMLEYYLSEGWKRGRLLMKTHKKLN